MFCFEHQSHVILFKVSFETITLWGSRQYITSTFIFFLKKPGLKNSKNH